MLTVMQELAHSLAADYNLGLLTPQGNALLWSQFCSGMGATNFNFWALRL